MDIGEILRTERQKRELSIAEVEEATKIRAKYLLALEEENFQEIPGEAYRMGFLRNYARFLEIDPGPLLDQYKSQKKDEQSASSIIDEQTEIEERTEISRQQLEPARFFAEKRKVFWGLIIFAVLIFSIAFAYYNSLEKEKTPATPPVSQNQESEPQKEKPPAAEEKEDKIVIELAGKQRCWARVTVDGSIAFEGELNSGETKKFEAKDSIRVRLGNAGGVDVIYNGTKQPPLGESGAVVEKEYTKSI